MDLLTELVLDSGYWLELKGLTSEEKQRLYKREKTTPAEQYWYDLLFPQWFNEPDPQLPRWKQEMMAGNFNQNDAALISSLSNEIERLGGSYIWRYILDLSMATDLALKIDLVESAVSLRPIRKYQRDRSTHGVDRVHLYYEDVEGDWLKEFSQEEEAQDLSQNSSSET